MRFAARGVKGLPFDISMMFIWNGIQFFGLTLAVHELSLWCMVEVFSKFTSTCQH